MRDRPVSRSPRALTALLVAPLLAGLAGCGAGRSAQTYTERTAADSTNVAVGALSVRNLSVLAPRTGEVLEAGSDATAILTVTSTDTEPDTLLEVTSPAAGSVVVLADGRQQYVVVPPLGSTGNAAQLLLQGLTSTLRTGQYVPMTLRFERNGSVQVQVPIELSGNADRPVFTREAGSAEGEPALQGPAGGSEGSGGGSQGSTGLDTAPNDNQPQDAEKGVPAPGESIPTPGPLGG